MATRTNKEERRHRKHLKALPKRACPFCVVKPGDSDYISETKYFTLMINLFPWSWWDDQVVEEHLMVVPKKHINSISKLPPEAAKEFLKILSDYEKKGYNIYARAPSSITKSVTHQHTHLVKAGEVKNLLIKSRKPYFFFMR